MKPRFFFFLFPFSFPPIPLHIDDDADGVGSKQPSLPAWARAKIGIQTSRLLLDFFFSGHRVALLPVLGSSLLRCLHSIEFFTNNICNMPSTNEPEPPAAWKYLMSGSLRVCQSLSGAGKRVRALSIYLYLHHVLLLLLLLLLMVRLYTKRLSCTYAGRFWGKKDTCAPP